MDSPVSYKNYVLSSGKVIMCALHSRLMSKRLNVIKIGGDEQTNSA